MIAAIYARKSTDQNGVSDEEKSVTRQVEHARAYAGKKGWTVAEEHVYADDGISGAEFVKRPGFLRLMNALKPRPPFQVLIMSEESRLGRESIETAYALKQLITAGVRVFFYLEDRERTLESPTEKLLLSVTAYTDEMEREKARQRTTDAMLRKARAGHVTGGRVFGYDNAEVRSPEGHRLRVERRVNDAEAPVVRRIFELYASGLGLRSVALRLNEERAPAPLPRRGGPRGWAPSSVRGILYRPLYRGQIVWNRSRKRDRWGVKRQESRPAEEWVTLDAPALRIVSEPLWQAAHERLTGARQAYLRGTDGKLWGRPGNGIESKYLLTGFAVCAACGGSLHVRSRSHGRQRALFYGCTSYHLRGRTVCENNLALSMGDTDAEVLRSFQEELLHPAVIDRGIAQTVAALSAPEVAVEEHRAAVIAELQAVRARWARLMQVLDVGGDIPTLAAELRQLDRRRGELEAELEALKCPVAARPDPRRLEAELRSYFAQWREMLGRGTMQARQMVGKLLSERIMFYPRDGEAEFVARASVGRLIKGLVVPKAMVAPTGYARKTVDPLVLTFEAVALAAA